MRSKTQALAKTHAQNRAATPAPIEQASSPIARVIDGATKEPRAAFEPAEKPIDDLDMLMRFSRYAGFTHALGSAFVLIGKARLLRLEPRKAHLEETLRWIENEIEDIKREMAR